MPDDDLKFELDGPDVHKRTVDTEALLALFIGYLALVRKAAADRGAEVMFIGMDVEEKCVQLVATPSDTGAALIGASAVSDMLSHRAPTPESLKNDLRRFRSQIYNFPQQITRTTVKVGESGPIGVDISLEAEQPPAEMVAETFSGRAVVTRAGGSRPTVRLSSRLEPKEMTLVGEKDLIKAIGAHLYKEVEVDARVWRDESGVIVKGELVDFEPVTDGDPTEAWGAFFRAAGEEWSDMSADEINEEIGRG